MYCLLSGEVAFEVSLSPGSGQFEVLESGSLVVSVLVSVPNDPVLQIPVCERSETDNKHLIALTGGDVYKELRLRGYDYGPTFQGIHSANNEGGPYIPVSDF